MKALAAFLLTSLLVLPGYAINRINISPSDIDYLSLEYGEVPLNQTALAEIGINAPSDRPVDIHELLIFGDMYAATTDCGDQVAAGEYCVIDIYFTPTATGEHYGEMSIKTSEGNILLKLYGTGI
ncbi:hypothetical protein EZJ49_08125 [Bdellovibrio bacteriovorus]|uniref:hypothetical protein n=1 Tax=Bdellovibrio bacteriovorus TaxID=959 RepID=UPI0021D190B4|nr:hypothetical protein [Bdellovibrio bacteriovorus]UXR66214.1 hypothetical protein EZJ49_08125 [Bdellovibrio bacteriovorus]